MEKKNLPLGLFAAIMIAVTAGLALPMVKMIELKPEQLLLVRGLLTALLAFVFTRGRVTVTDPTTWWIAVTVPFASLGLFMGISTWGAGPTLIVITATPAINFLVSVVTKHKIGAASIVSFICLLAGITLALWEGTFSAVGLAWSVGGMLCNAVLYEEFNRSEDELLVICFWGSLGIAVMGYIVAIVTNSVYEWGAYWTSPPLFAELMLFAVVGGFCYWMANLYAFRHLDKEPASVLAQLETPAVVIAASIMLHERMNAIQWFGLCLAFAAAAYLIVWTIRVRKSTS